MEKLFSDQNVNSGRQAELDLAKCSAIFFMIFLHSLSLSSSAVTPCEVSALAATG